MKRVVKKMNNCMVEIDGWPHFTVMKNIVYAYTKFCFQLLVFIFILLKKKEKNE